MASDLSIVLLLLSASLTVSVDIMAMEGGSIISSEAPAPVSESPPSVQARKGVIEPPLVNSTNSTLHAEPIVNLTLNTTSINLLSVSETPSVKNVTESLPSSTTSTVKPSTTNTPKINVTSPIPKKPNITKSLSEVDTHKIPPQIVSTPSTTSTVKTAPNTTVSSSLIPPISLASSENIEKTPVNLDADSFYHSPSIQLVPNRTAAPQSNLVIPLVISMFALPLLALIAYQAIRRGKDAWKNRHYRRVDYLIDGMYNES